MKEVLLTINWLNNVRSFITLFMDYSMKVVLLTYSLIKQWKKFYYLFIE